MLHGEPLTLEEPPRSDASVSLDAPVPIDEPASLVGSAATAVARRAWATHCAFRDGHWSIRWRPLHKLDGLDCRIDRLDATAAMFSELHEQSRAWSPFNYELYVRLNRGESVIGAAFGRRIEFDGRGAAAPRPLRGEDRIRFLIEEIGIHEELAHELPPDLPTPPPPPAPSL
jgi:hypothetical protein